jgi:hypothetical protein
LPPVDTLVVPQVWAPPLDPLEQAVACAIPRMARLMRMEHFGIEQLLLFEGVNTTAIWNG